MMRLTNADGTSCVITKEELASAFNRWMERYLAFPEAFEREFQMVGRFVDERTKGKPTYGDLSAEYLLGLIDHGPPPPPLAEERFRCEKPDATQLDRIELKLHQLREEIRIMAEDIKALDSAVALEASDVAALATGVTNLATAQATAFADLLAKIAANPTANFTAEVTTLANNHTAMTQALSTVTTALAAAAAADPGAVAAAVGGIQTITG